MKKQLRYGFTLVELLVVISIIGMLAGLLLPAVQAAREAGRRATCVSNQSQAALAIINYDSAKTYLPPIRKQLATVTIPPPAGGQGAATSVEIQASWVGLILPYFEQTTAWDRLSGWTAANTTSPLFELTLPALKCKSNDVEGTRVSYVVNGGYQNAYGGWASISSSYKDPARREDAPFFDYLIDDNGTTTGPRDKGPTVSLDYISMHSGTSNTILLSENLQAGEWIFKSNGSAMDTPTSSGGYPGAYGEDRQAFCYPVNKTFEKASNWPSDNKGLVYATGDSATPYSNPDEDTNPNASWKGYDTIGEYNPLFINVARVTENYTLPSGVTTLRNYNTARPSSNHPGIVIAAFADRGAKSLSENIDKKVFVQICQPSSGAIIKSLD
jgi:prepilin-type N-terminal cleavage/methylation domain-containing protein